MIDAEKLTTSDLITSLSSKRCPACGKAKRPRHTFCGRDYHDLPEAMRHRLYDRVHNGYAQAVAAAMNHLGATEFLLPLAAGKEAPAPAASVSNRHGLFDATGAVHPAQGGH